MESPSAWQRLHASLRRLIRLRELQAPPEILDNEVSLARRHFSNVPPPPRGGDPIWDADLEVVARELGFLPDPRERPPVSEWFGGQVAKAARLQHLVGEIAREIRESLSVEDLHVVAAGSTFQLTGTAPDVQSRERAGQIAQRIAEFATVENCMTVRSSSAR